MLCHHIKLNKMEEEIITQEQDIVKPNEEIRDKILQFEDMLRNADRDKFGVFEGKDTELICPLKHSFSNGIYVREISVPAGMFVVGKIHKHDHPNFLLKGDVIVVTEDGVEELSAPLSMISKGGIKRAIYAKTDLIWTTVHLNPTNTEDLDKLEGEITANNYEEYETFKSLKNEEIKQLKT